MKGLTLAILTTGALWVAPPPAARAAETRLRIDTPMSPPKWARLQRELLADHVPACRAFYKACHDERGYVKCFIRWGANDGPDDAFENFNHWPELHALGASDEILQLCLKGHEGMLKQYTEARTVETPIARGGMYYQEFCVQSDWMHHGEGLQLFNRLGLSMPADATHQERARRFAGFYMDEDPEAQNYDPARKLIRSMLNGSKGPMLRKATATDWVGDSFDVTGFVPVHGERNFAEFLAHYAEYGDVVGDHFINLGTTSLPLNAWLLTRDEKYRRWILDYMDAWLERMKQNGGVIPSYVDLDGRIGGAEGKWWGNAYGWGFSPVNPVTGQRNDRNRIARALPGFNAALWVSGDQKYVDAWRNMMDAVNANARVVDGVKQYPTMHGAQGWYGWQKQPWDVGALEVWYWSMKPEDAKRIGPNEWIDFLEGRNPAYPEIALQRDIDELRARVKGLRRNRLPPERRLADNMLRLNPASVESLIQLMLGGLMPGRDGGLLNARLRYFDAERKRAGVPEDVAALVTEMTDAHTVVTLVNLSRNKPRTLIVQGGAYGEHRLESVTVNGRRMPIDSPLLAVELQPRSGARLVLQMKRYANTPTAMHPWDR
ncbi:MAG: hypothetical protein AB1705_20975 [Verrucomicrobiota bacterium]